MRFVGSFLGQVRLVRRPSLATKPTLTWRDITPPPGAVPPGAGCVYLGGRSFLSSAAVDRSIEEARAAGYTDIHEIDVPPCVPSESDPCLVSSGTFTKYVWACPTKGTVPTAVDQTTLGPAPASGAQPAETGIPTVALAVGGLAAAGLLAYLIFR